MANPNLYSGNWQVNNGKVQGQGSNGAWEDLYGVGGNIPQMNSAGNGLVMSTRGQQYADANGDPYYVGGSSQVYNPGQAINGADWALGSDISAAGLNPQSYSPIAFSYPKMDTGDWVGQGILTAMMAGMGAMAGGAGVGAAEGAGAGAAEGGAFSSPAWADAGMAELSAGGGSSLGYGAAGADAGGGLEGLDTIGNMVQNVPQGMTASSYAQSLGYPSADAWLSSGAGTSAMAAGGGAGDGGAAANDSAQYGTQDAPVSVGGPGQFSIMNMLGGIFGQQPTGILARAASALGLPGPIANAIGPAYSIGSGIYGMMQGDQLRKRSQELMKQADPFGPYRDQYAQQLSQLMKDPSMITSMPGYKAGLQAVERRGAAQGWNGSGNMMASLADYGGSFYNNAVSQLSSLSGAGFNPANAANIGMTGASDAASIGIRGLDRVGYGITSRGPTSDIIMNYIMRNGGGVGA